VALQHRLWTSDRRVRKGLQVQTSECFLCLQEEDNTEHILVQCVYARQVWYKVFEDLNMEAQSPSHTDQLAHWWRFERGNLEKSKRKGFDYSHACLLEFMGLWKYSEAIWSFSSE
jgi:hypothetical protein